MAETYSRTIAAVSAALAGQHEAAMLAKDEELRTDQDYGYEAFVAERTTDITSAVMQAHFGPKWFERLTAQEVLGE